MNKEEAIKYLQQLYPNGGHCWLDEQRIEAIGMAIKALQEEPISEDLEKAAVEAFKQIVDSNKNSFLEIFKAGAKWKEKEMQYTIELAEDHAYFAGRTKTIDEMMEKAVETTFNVSLPLVIKKDEL